MRGLTRDEAQDLLGVSRSQLYKLRKKGLIDQAPSRQLHIDPYSVQRYALLRHSRHRAPWPRSTLAAVTDALSSGTPGPPRVAAEIANSTPMEICQQVLRSVHVTRFIATTPEARAAAARRLSFTGCSVVGDDPDAVVRGYLIDTHIDDVEFETGLVRSADGDHFVHHTEGGEDSWVRAGTAQELLVAVDCMRDVDPGVRDLGERMLQRLHRSWLTAHAATSAA